jgi:hypothetical protein
MRIELPVGGPDALRDAFRGYADSQGLLFDTRGFDGQAKDRTPAVLVATKRGGVIIKIEVPGGVGAADIALQTTCYGEEEWGPHWREIKMFVASSGYRVLESTDFVLGRSDFVGRIDVRPLLSLPPLAPINTQQ